MIQCPKHGKLHGRKDAKYCPICGKEVINVSPFPLFRLYVWKNDLRNSIIALMIGAALWVGGPFVLTGMKGCQEEAARVEREEAAIIKSMPPEWEATYRSCKDMNTYDRDTFLIKFCEQNVARLSGKYLTPQQIEMFLKLVNTYERPKVAHALNNYLKVGQ